MNKTRIIKRKDKIITILFTFTLLLLLFLIVIICVKLEPEPCVIQNIVRPEERFCYAVRAGLVQSGEYFYIQYTVNEVGETINTEVTNDLMLIANTIQDLRDNGQLTSNQYLCLLGTTLGHILRAEK